MKQSIKDAKKKPSPNKKETRPHTAKEKGYKEEVFNGEQQSAYNKSDLAKNRGKNTAGPND